MPFTLHGFIKKHDNIDMHMRHHAGFLNILFYVRIVRIFLKFDVRA